MGGFLVCIETTRHRIKNQACRRRQDHNPQQNGWFNVILENKNTQIDNNYKNRSQQPIF